MTALQTNVVRAFRHRNFRLLWIGAFLSFVGSWFQNVAQGWLVWEMTHSEWKLGVVTFCGVAPIILFGPIAGTLADVFHKRAVLIVAQLLFGGGALTLGILTHLHVVQYWHIVAVALLFGFVSAFEVPTRQSLISRCVPQEDLAAAVPINAMTFNAARFIGPAIGTLLLVKFGAGVCYDLNGLSFLALVYSVVAISADMTSVPLPAQPVTDLMMEGLKYTFRDTRLRTLFIMESLASGFGLFYASLLPAVAEMIGLGREGYGALATAIGIGGLSGLALVVGLSHLPLKGNIVRSSMAILGLCLFVMGFVSRPLFAFPLFVLIGAAAIMQFNTTNTLFQLLSPNQLRGRVLSMHQWALSGLGSVGTLFFGWLAEYTRRGRTVHLFGSPVHLGFGGLPLVFRVGGAGILICVAWAWYKVGNLSEDP